jgi:hypothetical protein
MGVDGTGVNDQPLVELCSSKDLGFRFSLKCPGRSRPAPARRQHAGSAHLKSDVPSCRHVSPRGRSAVMITTSEKLECPRAKRVRLDAGQDAGVRGAGIDPDQGLRAEEALACERRLLRWKRKHGTVARCVGPWRGRCASSFLIATAFRGPDFRRPKPSPWRSIARSCRGRPLPPP